MRAYFIKQISKNASTVTTIAPTPFNGTLASQGWRYVVEGRNGEIVREENADAARARILTGFGH